MIHFKTDLYLIRCITNLHAGSGDADYGVIDNLVQRDPVTSFPCIHASSLKGAIREYFEEYVEDNPDGFISYIFGSDRNEKDNQQTGSYRFFGASLMSLPVRSTGKPSFRCFSKRTIEDFTDFSKSLNLSINEPQWKTLKEITASPVIFEGTENTMLENHQANLYLDATQINSILNNTTDGLSKFLGTDVAFCSDENEFKEFTENLPVIARNQLENGESKNLWYEEVVPRETRFYTFISVPYANGSPEQNDFYIHFSNNIDGGVIQIGANATIGYGFCEFKKMN